MAEWVWKGGLDSAVGLLRLVFDTAALRRQQLGYTAPPGAATFALPRGAVFAYVPKLCARERV